MRCLDDMALCYFLEPNPSEKSMHDFDFPTLTQFYTKTPPYDEGYSSKCPRPPSKFSFKKAGMRGGKNSPAEVDDDQPRRGK